MSSSGAQTGSSSKPKDALPSLTTTTRSPSSATPLASRFEPLSSAEILERVPTSVVRLLAALSPFIHATNRFVRLATWTGGPGSSSSSVLLLVSWWIICSFGYQVIRYAPQALILGWISYAWLEKQLSAAKTGGRVYDKQDVVSSSTINATLMELSELADFFSAFRRSILVPAVELLSWDPSPNNTKAVAAFVLITWPLWIAAFLPWDQFKLPSLVLPVSGGAIVGTAYKATGAARSLAIRALGPHAIAAINEKVAPIISKYQVLEGYVARTPLPAIHRYLSLLSSFQLRRFSNFDIRILPPYPIAALSVRSLLCIGGTLALTWCSPWCALIRQATWKSATLRRLVRGTGRILSGQRPFSSAWGVGNLDDEYTNTFTHESLLRAPTSASKPDTKTEATTADPGVTRHTDVIYQFSIFENQRWWIGLDWTAALLPQERPSWSDESNNPVSPPSSFSLPPARVTLTPFGESFNRRTVNWQWLDPEWTIAGAAKLVQDENAPEEEDWDVDNDGWQYGDNAWDKMSKKAGMGRYTRRRKWVRRAVLVEVVERGVAAPAGEEDKTVKVVAATTASTEVEKETDTPVFPGAAQSGWQKQPNGTPT